MFCISHKDGQSRARFNYRGGVIATPTENQLGGGHELSHVGLNQYISIQSLRIQ